MRRRPRRRRCSPWSPPRRRARSMHRAFAGSARSRAERGLAAFEPDGPMYEHAAVGFGDLRVLDARGRQVPWRPRYVRGDRAAAGRDGAERRHAGSAAVALLDFGPERVVRERIQLDVPLRAVRRPRRGLRQQRPADVHAALLDGDLRRARRDARGQHHGRLPAERLPLLPHPRDGREGDSAVRPPRRSAAGRRSGAAARGDRDAPGGAANGDRRRRAAIAGVPVHELRFASSTPAFDRPVNVYGSMDGKAYFLAGGGRLYRFGETGETTRPAQQPLPLSADPDRERRRRAAARPACDAARVPRLHPARARASRRPTASSTAARGRGRTTTSRSSPRYAGRARRGRARPGAPERGLRAAGRHPARSRSSIRG